MRRVASPLLALGLALFVAAEAHAFVPDPSKCSCPPVVTITPDGSCCFDVLVRDYGNNPLPGSVVRVDFGTCAVTLCPTQPAGVIVMGNGVAVITEATGRAHVCVCGTFTGTCSALITADGVILCTVPMTNNCSPTATQKASWGTLKIVYR